MAEEVLLLELQGYMDANLCRHSPKMSDMLNVNWSSKRCQPAIWPQQNDPDQTYTSSLYLSFLVCQVWSIFYFMLDALKGKMGAHSLNQTCNLSRALNL